MYKSIIAGIAALFLIIPVYRSAGQQPEELTPASVLECMKKAADWQIGNPSKHKIHDWTQGAYYCGLSALAGIAGDGKYADEMLRTANACEWSPGKRKYHADDHCVFQSFIELYEKQRIPGSLSNTIAWMDSIIAAPKDGSLDFTLKDKTDRWSWCDSLFMSPPVWARLAHVTEDKKYLDYMDRYWWKTSEYLYDNDEHLYFRDSTYFKKKEANGKKVFWGRGNGWVIGGLVRVLQYLPEKHPTRSKYIEQFSEMMEKIAAAQQSDGLWRASLLDPDSYPAPETSSSGFFLYGLAWGVNQGILDEDKYKPAAKKAWQALASKLAPDGMLRWVQPIGADPKSVKESDTEVYGVGAFLLSGSEMFKMLALENDSKIQVEMVNKLPFLRTSETVELTFKDLLEEFKGIDCDRIVVMDDLSSRIIPSQVLYDCQGKPQKLIFQADVPGNAKRKANVILVDSRFPMPVFTSRVFCMFVPQRKDDFAWENDRMAYRMYGPALQNTPGEVSGSGVDVWAKKVSRLVISSWYSKDDYHKDHGEGLDFYKVGTSRGCGGTAVFSSGKYYTSANYAKWNITANGPVRTEFELAYDQWQADGKSVSEMKTISLDAGSFLTKFSSYYRVGDDSDLKFAVGIAKRAGGGTSKVDAENGWMSYSEPEDRANGVTFCGAVVLPSHDVEADAVDSDVYLRTKSDDEPEFEYYAGAAWSKAGYFSSIEQWNRHLEKFRAGLDSPLKVRIK